MVKKFVALGIALLMCLSLTAACQSEKFVENKAIAKTTLETYAREKGYINYSAVNWMSVGEFVADGKIAIDAAKNNNQVDNVVETVKKSIDAVPKEQGMNYAKTNGAYFITDESWESYVRSRADFFGANESWIQDVLNGGDGGALAHYSIRQRDVMWVAIYGDALTISEEGISVYRFYLDGDYYTCQSSYSTITFVLTDDILTVQRGSDTTQYRRNNSYEQSKEIPSLRSIPTNIEHFFGGEGLNYAMLRWVRVDTAGALAGVEIQKAGTQDYSLHKIAHAYNNEFIVQFSHSDFMQGVNTVRIYHIGYPFLLNNQVCLSANSKYTVFSFIIDAKGNLTIKKVVK